MTAQPLALNGVVFDFDGTLAELNINFAGMKRTVLALAADLGVEATAIEGLHVLEAIEAAVQIIAARNALLAERFHADACAAVSAIEIAAARKGSLLPGSREMLLELRKRHVKSAVITRNCRLAVTTVFPDIASHCDAFIPREQTNHVKPHPEHLLAALKSLAVLPEQAVMVGDHPLDMKAGQNAGVLTAGVLTGNASRDALKQAGADYIFASAAGILAILPDRV